MSAPRLRFAPSPTGYLHIGGARTALFCWLHARRQGGKFILRIEDTDRERSTEASVQAIIDGMRWLGLDWDEGPEVGGPHGPYFQIERMELYRTFTEQLIADGHAYRCYCTKEELDARRKVFEKQKRPYKYEGTCRERTDAPEGARHVVRFKMPREEGSLTFDDEVLGRITKQYDDLDDWIMIRADGIPLYNFSCVIDDHHMEIDLVGRGQEHINSTFPQLMLYRVLGWEPPGYAHFPLILGPDREKLSKRRHPEADVMLHRQSGILPEALLNFVVRLGWSHGNDEVITRDQMVEWFGFDHVGTTSGVWNPEKLLWLNQQHLRLLDAGEVAKRLRPFLSERGVEIGDDGLPKLEQAVLALRERTRTLAEMAELAACYFTRGVTLDEKAAKKHLGDAGRKALTEARSLLGAHEDWSIEALDAVVQAVSEKTGLAMGKVAQPVRVAVTGRPVSPGIGETLRLVGKEETLLRIDEALARTAETAKADDGSASA